MKIDPKNKIKVNFYYLKSEFKKVLLLFCKKISLQSEKLLVNLDNDNDLRLVDDYLWTNDRNGFIPHTVFDEKLSEIEKIVLFTGSYRNMTNLENFKQIVIAPNVKVESLRHFNKFFIFSNETMNNRKLSEIQKKLENKNFDCKYFYEYQDLKWKLLN